jgi:NAD(P)-dependent dehydrogenase (short-subunit alcohol dehydrogenase family)
MRDLDGKTAFVTGGASGIGLAMGRAFAEAGMGVMLADIEAKPLEQTVAAFKGNLTEVRGVVRCARLCRRRARRAGHHRCLRQSACLVQ